MILVLDSSALAKRYLREPGTEVVLDLIENAELVLASRLTWVEITSAVVRIGRSGRLPELAEVIRAVDDDFSTLINILEVTAPLMANARVASVRHGLRAADAIQFATAKAACEWHGSAVTHFVCSDRDLLTAVDAEELKVIDPVRNCR